MSFCCSKICIVLAIFCLKIITTSGYSADQPYIIRLANNLVLDGTDPLNVRLQYFTGFKPQLWKFQIGIEPGLFYIINKHDRMALDYQKATYPAQQKVQLKPRTNSLDQQWYVNCNGSITNAGNKLHIVPSGYRVDAGNIMDLWPVDKHQFTIERKI